MKIKAAIISVFILLGCFNAIAAPPMDILEPKVKSVLDILKNPKTDVPDPIAFQQKQIWDIVYEVFDFTELSKRALGKNWKKFNTDQKKAFIIAFSDLLGTTYLSKIDGNFKDEEVRFIEQTLVSDTQAVVKSEVIRKNGTSIPMDYKMRYKKNLWRIYDIKVEGISLIKNYRTQFDKFLFKNSPDALIDKLKLNTEQIKKEAE